VVDYDPAAVRTRRNLCLRVERVGEPTLTPTLMTLTPMTPTPIPMTLTLMTLIAAPTTAKLSAE
jgi:hypothetical protein